MAVQGLVKHVEKQGRGGGLLGEASFGGDKKERGEVKENGVKRVTSDEGSGWSSCTCLLSSFCLTHKRSELPSY